MISKDVFLTLTKKQKEEKVVEALTQLDQIAKGKHPISHRFDQGRLSSVKKDLETFVINTLNWESNKQQNRYH